MTCYGSSWECIAVFGMESLNNLCAEVFFLLQKYIYMYLLSQIIPRHWSDTEMSTQRACFDVSIMPADDLVMVDARASAVMVLMYNVVCQEYSAPCMERVDSNMLFPSIFSTFPVRYKNN